jgi:hypothetical protein
MTMDGWIRKFVDAARDFAHGVDTANAIRHGVPIAETHRLSPESVNAIADAERERARLNWHLLAQIEEIAHRRARVN